MGSVIPLKCGLTPLTPACPPLQLLPTHIDGLHVTWRADFVLGQCQADGNLRDTQCVLAREIQSTCMGLSTTTTTSHTPLAARHPLLTSPQPLKGGFLLLLGASAAAAATCKKLVCFGMPSDM